MTEGNVRIVGESLMRELLIGIFQYVPRNIEQKVLKYEWLFKMYQIILQIILLLITP